MAMTAAASSERVTDTHMRLLLLPFSSRLSVRVSPAVSVSIRDSVVSASVAVDVSVAAVLSLLAKSTVVRLSLRLVAPRLSRMRLRSGGVPVMLSVGRVVS